MRAPREHLSFKEWVDLLLNVDVDISSGTLTSGWDVKVDKRMARVKFVQTVRHHALPSLSFCNTLTRYSSQPITALVFQKTRVLFGPVVVFCQFLKQSLS
jgi:hypothetical protein